LADNSAAAHLSLYLGTGTIYPPPNNVEVDICPVELISWLTRWSKRRHGPDTRQALSCLTVTRAVGLLELQSDYKYWKQANWSASLCPNTATGTRGLAITLERRNLMRAPLYCLLTTRSLRRTFIHLFIHIIYLLIY
jgi:hypothetical protein